MKKYTTVSLIALVLGTLSGCGHSADGHRASATDTLPPEVVALCHAIADGDSTTFASLVQYPLERPYPLHNIADTRSMRHYFSTMVDDSLKHVVAADTAHWHKYGWRGWAPDGGEYLWVDSLVYSITYLSQREQAIIDSVSRKEIATLPPDMQGHWRPERCFAGGSLVYRIDRDTVPEATSRYRLSVFHIPVKPGQRPTLIASGTKVTEGSAATISYTFDSDATSYIIIPYPDADNPTPVIINSSATDSVTPITPAYWLELIQQDK